MRKKLTAFLIAMALLLLVSGCRSGTQEAKSWDREPVFSYVFAGMDPDVMPISAYYGPHAGLAYNGYWYDSIITSESYQKIADAGLNLLWDTSFDCLAKPDMVTEAMDYAAENGIKYVFQDNLLIALDNALTYVADAQTFLDRVGEYSDHEGFAGLYSRDEPSLTKFPYMVDAYEKFKAAFGENKLFFYNLLPIYAPTSVLSGSTVQGISYENYLDEFLNQVKPPYLSYDYYPFKGSSGMVSESYFTNLSLVRGRAEAKGIPFWVCIQNGGQWEGDSTVRIPVESEILWQVNTSLVYGAKALQYFPGCHIRYWPEMESGSNGILDLQGNRTPLYYYVQKANRQAAAVDHILMNSRSMGVMQGGESPAPINGSEKLESFRELKTLSGTASLVGCFDYQGKTVLYVMNNSISESGIVELGFDANYTYEVIQRAQLREASGQKLRVKLNAGEGALVRLM